MKKNAGVQPVARNQAIEVLRILSAFGIVAYHANVPGKDVAYAGLVAFLIMAPYVDLRYNYDKIRSSLDLARTLLIPWAFWWVFYGILHFALHHAFFSETNPISNILYGTSAHLWFVPFIFLALVAINTIKSSVKPRLLFWGSSLLGALFLAGEVAWPFVMANAITPFPQWVNALGPVLLGVAMGVAHKVPRKEMVLAASLVACVLAFLAIKSIDGVSIPYVVGALLCVLFFNIRLSLESFNVQGLSRYMFGVYLIHIFFLTIFRKVIGDQSYLAASCAFAFSLVAVMLVARFAQKAAIVVGLPLRKGPR